MSTDLLRIGAVLLLAVMLGACTEPRPDGPGDGVRSDDVSSEEVSSDSTAAGILPLKVIPLAAPLDSTVSEISSLTWCEDQLVLLPQYPSALAGGDSAHIFQIPRRLLLDFLSGTAAGPLEAHRVPIETKGLRAEIEGFDGFESIAYSDPHVYLTIEAQARDSMRGYLVRGTVAAPCGRITLEPSTLRRLPTQANVPGLTYEALFEVGGRGAAETIVAMHEAAGVRVNPQPRAVAADPSLDSLRPLPAPSIEYRITDATNPGSNGRFWVINYFFPGEERTLRPGPDSLLLRYGRPGGADIPAAIERLVQLEYRSSSISLADAPPLYLTQTAGGAARNWEGVALLSGEGFFIATDTYPETILAFAPYAPEDE